MKLTKENIRNCLSDLSDNLKKKDIKGEILMVGGAAMIFSFNARATTQDIDAVFEPEKEFRDSVFEVGIKNQLEPGWLNNAVQVFITGEKFEKI